MDVLIEFLFHLLFLISLLQEHSLGTLTVDSGVMCVCRGGLRVSGYVTCDLSDYSFDSFYFAIRLLSSSPAASPSMKDSVPRHIKDTLQSPIG